MAIAHVTYLPPFRHIERVPHGYRFGIIRSFNIHVALPFPFSDTPCLYIPHRLIRHRTPKLSVDIDVLSRRAMKIHDLVVKNPHSFTETEQEEEIRIQNEEYSLFDQLSSLSDLSNMRLHDQQ